MTPEQEMRRGEDAARILAEPLFKEAMEKVRSEVIAQWSAAPARDTQGREWLWQFYQVAAKFENTLVSVMETGKMASLSQKESLREKAARVWGAR
jgi:hypothetical protein